MEGTIQAHVNGDVPNIVLHLEKLDEETISAPAGKIPFPSFPSLSPYSCFHHSVKYIILGS